MLCNADTRHLHITNYTKLCFYCLVASNFSSQKNMTHELNSENTHFLSLIVYLNITMKETLPTQLHCYGSYTYQLLVSINRVDMLRQSQIRILISYKTRRSVWTSALDIRLLEYFKITINTLSRL